MSTVIATTSDKTTVTIGNDVVTVLSEISIGPQGPRGDEGAPGPPGLDGTNGVDGAPGPPGLDGTNGVDGAIGPPGLDGTNGVDGAIGPEGPPGPPGLDGTNGVDGAPGPPGLDGINGVDGEDGAIGPEGPPGLDGINGVDGEDGAIGPEGPPGLDGTNGVDGEDGAPGAPGLQGDIGPQGPQGDIGPPGPPGPPGLDGEDGAPGPQGDIGLTGPEGPEGPEGSGTQWRDPVATASVLPTNTEQLSLGNDYSSNTGSYHNDPGANACKFIGKGLATYKNYIKFVSGVTGTRTVYIYTDNAGIPGTDTGITPVVVTPVVGETIAQFDNIDLTNGVTYWAVWFSPTSNSRIMMAEYQTNKQMYTYDTTIPFTDWMLNNTWSIVYKVTYGSILAMEGDIRAAKDTDSIYYFDGTDWHKIGDTTGLLTETTHDALDHAGLTGIPSVAGLLNESSHDALDHEGLLGIGYYQWKGSVADLAGLPGTQVINYNDGIAANSGWDNFASSTWQGSAFLGKGSGGYSFRTRWFDQNYSADFEAKIYTNNAGNPGTLVATASATNNPTNALYSTWNFGNLNLTFGITYHLVIHRLNGSGTIMLRQKSNGDGSLRLSSNGTSWSGAGSYATGIEQTFADSDIEIGDIRLQLDTGQIKRWSGSAWVIISDITGLLNESSHDALDHAGLTGIPSVAGLLNESSHDALDHDGLVGVGDHQWKAPVASAATLPGVLGLYLTKGATTSDMNDNFGGHSYHACSITGNGEGNYQFKSVWRYASSPIVLEGKIYTNNNGVPGTVVASADATHTGGSENEEIIFNFTGINLLQGSSYWYVAHRISGATANMEQSDIGTNGKLSTNGTSWINAHEMYLRVWFSGGVNVIGDILLQLDTGQIKRWSGSAWVIISDITGLLNESSHDALDHAGLTGIPSVTGLLNESSHDALDHAGLTGIPSVAGLLNESSHDALDHTGLTGIPSAAGGISFAFPGELAANDEITLILPVARTIVSTWGLIFVSTVPTDADLVIDILQNGTSIYATTTTNRPTVTDNDADGWGVVGEPDDLVLAVGDRITAKVLSVGSTVAGSDASLTLFTV